MLRYSFQIRRGVRPPGTQLGAKRQEILGPAGRDDTVAGRDRSWAGEPRSFASPMRRVCAAGSDRCQIRERSGQRTECSKSASLSGSAMCGLRRPQAHLRGARMSASLWVEASDCCGHIGVFVPVCHLRPCCRLAPCRSHCAGGQAGTPRPVSPARTWLPMSQPQEICRRYAGALHPCGCEPQFCRSAGV